MAKKEDDKVTSLVARRTQQRKAKGEEVYKDPVMKAADEISALYGRLGSRMDAEKLLVAIYLAERALYVVLRSAVGPGHTNDIRKQAIERACKEYSLHDEHVPDVTVFDEEPDDPKPTG